MRSFLSLITEAKSGDADALAPVLRSVVGGMTGACRLLT
jgi:hypothetical protein